MKYAVEMGSGAMIYSYIKSFCHSKVDRGIHSMEIAEAFFYFFQNKERRIKIRNIAS
jgi:hypothetical protein